MAGGGGFSNVGLMNDKGELLWEYLSDPELRPFDMEGGDLNKDGIPEFYVGSHDGLYILDMNRKLVKKIGPLWIHDVEIGKYNGGDIIIGLSRNIFYFWDYKGNLIKRIDVKGNFSRFEIVDWPEKNHLLTNNGNYIYLFDFDGNIVFKKKIGIHIFATNGTSVQFKKFDRRNFAVVANYRSKYNRSLLCIFSPAGELIFREILQRTQAIVAVDRNHGKSHFLLVGGFPKIKKYELE